MFRSRVLAHGVPLLHPVSGSRVYPPLGYKAGAAPRLRGLRVGELLNVVVGSYGFASSFLRGRSGLPPTRSLSSLTSVETKIEPIAAEEKLSVAMTLIPPWRKDRDSNPGGLSTYTLSRRAPRTNRTPSLVPLEGFEPSTSWS